jgi:hypothetical protein
MAIDDLCRESREFERLLTATKRELAPADIPWYPYGTLTNFVHLDRLLTGRNRELLTLIGEHPVADVGGADGDMCFFLERKGVRDVDMIDFGPTNYNSLRGARWLRDRLRSNVAIHEVDLDAYFTWPRSDYGMVFFLGVLYHLKNPYYVLESLAHVTRYCLLSTRVARLGADRKTRMKDQALAYLLAPGEANNDPTNYWIFSEVGLRRLLQRTGWVLLDYLSVGDTRSSDPVSAAGDERAFALLHSSRHP